MVLIWVCQHILDVCLVLRYPPLSRSLLHCFPHIQQSTVIDPSLQLMARFVPNQFLSLPPLLLFAFPSLQFSHHPHMSPTYPLPPMLLPHTLRSPGSLPARWFQNSRLREINTISTSHNGLLHLSYMIFVVKACKHPSPPPVCFLSSPAQTIRRKQRVMKGGGGRKRARQRERGLCGV